MAIYRNSEKWSIHNIVLHHRPRDDKLANELGPPNSAYRGNKTAGPHICRSYIHAVLKAFQPSSPSLLFSSRYVSNRHVAILGHHSNIVLQPNYKSWTFAADSTVVFLPGFRRRDVFSLPFNMGYTWDPEVWQGVKPIFEAAASGPKAPVGDALARRNAFEPLLAHMVGALPPAPDVKTHDYYARATDGHEVLCRWFYKADAPSQPGPAIVHCHGGGMILGTVPLFSPAIAAQVSLTGVPMLSVDYRRAPEHPHPTLVEDCYVGLIWLRDHAKELNVDPARIAVMGGTHCLSISL